MAEELTNLRKAAIALLAMGPEQAELVLRTLDREAIRRLTQEMGLAQGVSMEQRQLALSEFIRSVSGSDAPTRLNAFASLHETDTTMLLDSIRDEHPQTVALVLAHLPPNKASELLAGLPPQKQVEVVKRIAGIDQISSEVIDQVERGLRQRLGHIMGRTVRSGGVSAVAEILNAADQQTGRKILSTLEADAPHLVEQIRRVQAIFEDLLHARDEDIRAVLEQLDHETISLAMRTAHQGLKRKVLWNLPAEEARQIGRELQSVAPVSIHEIEAAQQRVAEVVHRLEAAGEIDLVTPASTAASAARVSSMSVLSGESSDEGDAERV